MRPARAFRMSVFVFSRIPKMQQFALTLEKDRLVIDIHVKRHFSSGISYPDLFESRFQIPFSQFRVESLVTRTVSTFPLPKHPSRPVLFQLKLKPCWTWTLCLFFRLHLFSDSSRRLLCSAQVNFYEIYIIHSTNLWKRHTSASETKTRERYAGSSWSLIWKVTLRAFCFGFFNRTCDGFFLERNFFEINCFATYGSRMVS